MFAALVMPVSRPSIEISGFDLVESKGSIKSLQMKADSAALHKAENILVLRNLNTSLWGKPKTPFKVSGDVGLLSTETNDFVVQTHAEVRSPDGFLFSTKTLNYSDKSRQLETDDLVQARSIGTPGSAAKVSIVGKGLTMNLATNEHTIHANVVATQQLEKNNTLNVKASRATFYPETSSAIFQRKVEVKSPSMSVSGDRLDISFSFDPETQQHSVRELLLEGATEHGKKKKISAKLDGLSIASEGLRLHLGVDGGVESSEAVGSVDAVTKDGVAMKAEKLVSDMIDGKNRIRLSGNVNISTNQRDAVCEEAFFFPDTGDLTLERIASVTKGTEILRGDRIRMSTRSSEVTVEQARGQLDKKNFKP